MRHVSRLPPLRCGAAHIAGTWITAASTTMPLPALDYVLAVADELEAGTMDVARAVAYLRLLEDVQRCVQTGVVRAR